jgi:CRISPR-associated protein Csd1
MKLVLTYGTEDAKRMARSDPDRQGAAYHCGRLLAILERAQQRAADSRLNATIVDRFYGAASTAPATTFGTLIDLAQTAHLPKIRRTERGYTRISELLEEVCSRIDSQNGFPRTLNLSQQAEFALGFYQQRAVFRAERPSPQPQ